MRALLVGLGSIGSRHLANLKLIDPSGFVVVWRRRTPERSAGERPIAADRVVYTLEDALDTSPEVALITSPATQHIETALALARQGVHLFIEKPLSHSLEGVDELLNECRRRGLVLTVGYNFRFYPPLQAMRQALLDGRIGRPVTLRAEAGQYLPDWRPGRDYRQTVSARSDLGGGAVLELSHELDLARWLLGEVVAVSAHLARLSDLEIDVEDTAEILLQFANGAIGNVHLDMVQRVATRTCRIIGTEGTLTWDWTTHQVRLFSAQAGGWTELHPAQELDRNVMYIAELRHFLDCVIGQQTPAVTGEDGRRVLEIALAAKRAAAEGRTVML